MWILLIYVEYFFESAYNPVRKGRTVSHLALAVPGLSFRVVSGQTQCHPANKILGIIEEKYVDTVKMQNNGNTTHQAAEGDLGSFFRRL